MTREGHGGGVRSSRPTNSGAPDNVDSTRRVDELIVQGQDLLARSKIDAAQKKFRQALGLCASSVGARSRLALTHLLQGESELAESEVKVVLEEAPDNVLALTTLAQVQAVQRRWPEAQVTVERALKCLFAKHAAGRAEYDDVANAVRMLAAMGDDRRLYGLYRRCVRGVPGRWDQKVLTHMGVAAFNMSRYVEARWLWREAMAASGGELEDVLDSLMFALDKIERNQVPPFTVDHRLRVETIFPGEEEPPGFVKAFAVRELWRSEDPADQEAALDLLARTDDPWATEFLFRLVRQPDLPDRLKMKAGVWLMEFGFIDEDEPLEMHVEGDLQPVFIERDEPEAPDDDDEAPHGASEWMIRELLDEAVAAHERGDEDAAEAAYREALVLDVDSVPAMVGLANLCRTTGREREAERLLAHALTLEPDNPVVLFNLAVLLAQRREFDKAQAVVNNLKALELPVDLWSAFYSLIGHLAPEFELDDRFGSDDPERADAEPGANARAGRDGGVEDDAVRKAAEAGERFARRPVDPSWSWPEALETLTLNVLRAAGRRLQVKNVWKMRKAELAEAVAARLRTQLPRVWQGLANDEREALLWIEAQGGIVSLERLQERFGPGGPVTGRRNGSPEAVARLQERGLLFVGRLPGAKAPVAVLLDETRRLLGELLSRFEPDRR